MTPVDLLDERIEERQLRDRHLKGSSKRQSIALTAVEHSRYSDRRTGLVRWFWLFFSIIVHAGLAIALLLRWHSTVNVAPPSAPLVVDLLPLASPSETPPEEKEASKPVKRAMEPETPPPPIELPKVLLPSDAPPTVSPREPPVDPGPKVDETAAPKTLPAPPAPQVASRARNSWEGKVLAALNAHRRYPRVAQLRRQQGVPYIRFVMDRDGNVLSSRLEHSSGFPDLDREAVALPKRAKPLPKPPVDRGGDTIELVVPVEFFLR